MPKFCQIQGLNRGDKQRESERASARARTHFIEEENRAPRMGNADMCASLTARRLASSAAFGQMATACNVSYRTDPSQKERWIVFPVFVGSRSSCLQGPHSLSPFPTHFRSGGGRCSGWGGKRRVTCGGRSAPARGVKQLWASQLARSSVVHCCASGQARAHRACTAGGSWAPVWTTAFPSSSTRGHPMSAVYLFGSMHPLAVCPALAVVATCSTMGLSLCSATCGMTWVSVGARESAPWRSCGTDRGRARSPLRGMCCAGRAGRRAHICNRWRCAGIQAGGDRAGGSHKVG